MTGNHNAFAVHVAKYRSTLTGGTRHFDGARVFAAPEERAAARVGNLSSRSSRSGADRYTVDFAAGTGQTTRWNNQTSLDIAHSLPRDRAERDRKLLVYTSPALDADMEVTGHPRVTLHLEWTARDGAVFVSGRRRSARDGPVRDGRSAPSSVPSCIDRAGAYVSPVPFGTFSTRDAMPMTPGEVAVDIDLFPISYCFRRGHCVRVAIAGADTDHFARYPIAPDEPFTFTTHRHAQRASAMTLPLIAR